MSTVQATPFLTPVPIELTRGRVYQCAFCQKKCWAFTRWCPHCRVDGALYVCLEETASGRTGPIDAGEYVPPDPGSLDAGEWLPVFPRHIKPGTVLLMRGAPGAGKTRSSLRLATHIGPAGIIELESPPDDCVDTATSAGADISPGRLKIWDEFHGEDTFREAEALGIKCLILDSYQKLGGRPTQWYDPIRRFARRQGMVIVITQSNARGGTRGGLGLEYDLAETTAMLTPTAKKGITKIEVLKNRRGTCGTFTVDIAGGERGLRRVK
jgi:hypothetical protein